jgi:phenylacetate-coenzyme A ligase PaaK-like adenylate-forming protein
MPEMIARLGWSREAVRAERQRALRRLLAVAQERSPWHRARLRGVDPTSFTEADLAGIPPMTKTEMMANFADVVTDRDLVPDLVNDWMERLPEHLLLLGRYAAVASGGSSGLRGVFVYDEAGVVMFSCMIGRWFARIGLPPLPPPGGGPMVSLWAGRGAHVSSLMIRLLPPPTTPLTLPATTPLPAMVERLNALQPWRIGAYASTLALLAAEARAGRLAIAPTAVMSCGEPLLPEVRAAVEAALGAPIYDYWGMSEGMYAMPCGPGPTMHLPDDLCIVEPVDDAGRPVPPGEPAAKILLTNLFNLVQPLIRYEVTDRVSVQATPCACGSAFQAVGGVDGRADDVFQYAGGVHVHPLTLRAPLGRERHVTEYQVCQTPEGAHVRVCVNGTLDSEAMARALEERLGQAGVAAPRVTLEIVPELGRQVSGKLKRFVPLAGDVPRS